LAASVLTLAEVVSRSPMAVPRAAAAVLVGVVVGNVARPTACRPGLAFVAHHVLRAGIVLLGLRITVEDLAGLGSRGLVLVAAVVVVTMVVTPRLAAAMGLSAPLGVLVATGYAICGVSAVAAVRSSLDAEDEDVAYAVALVTIFGTIAMVVLPIVGHLLALDSADFGAWVGASVHDVAQVVATASTGGQEALETAVPVKMGRVVLLAPLVAWVNVSCRRESTSRSQRTLVPPFVALFLVAVGVRSTGVAPASLVHVASGMSGWLISFALAAVGLTVDVQQLRRVGVNPLLFGAMAWLVVLALSLAIVGAT
jgi:uncharacterized integral membrane protein (TIGR00698 family)